MAKAKGDSKECRTCKETKSLGSYYHSMSTGWLTYRPDCKPCHTEKGRTRFQLKKNDWERVRRNAHYKKKFGITVGEYEALLDKQSGVCAICHRAPSKRRLHVDHNHKTGEIRGLLCYHCNRGLGWFDKVESAKRIPQYLEATLWGE